MRTHASIDRFRLKALVPDSIDPNQFFPYGDMPPVINASFRPALIKFPISRAWKKNIRQLARRSLGSMRRRLPIRIPMIFIHARIVHSTSNQHMHGSIIDKGST
jgi:hypothetical protein